MKKMLTFKEKHMLKKNVELL